MRTLSIVTTTQYRKDNNLPPITTEIDYPESANEAIEVWGSDLVEAILEREVTVMHQSTVRSKLEKKKDGAIIPTDVPLEEIADELRDWQPELRAKKDADDELAKRLAKVAPDRMAAVMARAAEIREGNWGGR